MPETTWKLTLKDGASSPAKRAHREVAALVRVLRDLQDVAPGASRALGGVVGAESIRNLRTQVGLTKELGRELRRNNGESRRAPRAGSGAPGAPANRSRTRQEGMFTLRESQRLRAMGDANQRRWDRQREQREARTRSEQSRERSREVRDNERHYRGIYRSQQSAQAWGRRRNEQASARNARAMEGVQAAGRRDDANPFGALARRASSSLPTEFLALGGAVGTVVAVLGQLYSAMTAITAVTLQTIAGLGALAIGLLSLTASVGGAVLQMIAFREGTLLTLSTLMRVDGEAGMSPEQRRAARANAAEGEFAWAQDLGRRTSLNTSQVVELRSQASAAGLQGADAQELTLAAADAGALHPNDSSTGSRFMLQMGQLRNSSTARATDYRPAAAAAGVNETAAIRRAAIAAGVVQRNGENESSYQRRIRTAQGDGSITGRQMYAAILEEQRQQHGGETGDFAKSQNGSMAAVLSNLGEGFQAFVTSMASVERLPGVLALKAMLTQVSDTLAGATNNGKRLQALFAGLLNQVGGLVGNVFGEGGFDSFITEVMDDMKDLLPLIRVTADEFKTGFMDGLRPLLSGFREAGGFVGVIRAALLAVLPDVRDFAKGLATTLVLMLQITRATLQLQAAAIIAMRAFAENPVAALAEGRELAGLSPSERELALASMRGVGEQMGDGVAAGFRSRQAFMQGEISSVMASLPATARTDLQIKSPSRVMAEIGQYMAEGVTVGLDSGAGGVQSAMSSVVAPPSLPGLSRGMGGMGAPIVVDVGGIHVNGAQDAAGVLDELRTKVEEIFVGVMERVALTGGA